MFSPFQAKIHEIQEPQCNRCGPSAVPPHPPLLSCEFPGPAARCHSCCPPFSPGSVSFLGPDLSSLHTLKWMVSSDKDCPPRIYHLTLPKDCPRSNNYFFRTWCPESEITFMGTPNIRADGDMELQGKQLRPEGTNCEEIFGKKGDDRQ